MESSGARDNRRGGLLRQVDASRIAALLGVAISVWMLGCTSGSGAQPQGDASGHANAGSPAQAMAGTSAQAGGGESSGGESGSAGGTSAGSAGQASTGPQLHLPIEVLGSGAPDEPVIAATTLTLANPDTTAVQTLYVQCHRCGFYDAPEFEALAKPLVKVKASLRIVGDASVTNSDAPWVDITNSTVQVDPMALAHGGINGGMVTLSFSLAVDATTRARLVAAPGTNRIEFRFNGTDGNSNGFRVLDVQLQDGAGNNLTPATKNWADISLEKTAGQNPTTASALGQALWSGRNLLTKSPIVPRKIRAACNDCHATDGRDLQYFNYSNNAIVQRSRFHGLTQDQGQEIAAYLRASLYAAKVPYVAAAAPWNPPFQPGPGLDSKPAVEWTAGAGLEAVLPDGKTFIKSLFGQPVDDTPVSVTSADVAGVLDATKVLNTRETRVPLQFPDWNAWLPPIHPLDIWTPDSGATAGLFETGSQNNNPFAVYQAIETWLEKNKNPNGVYGDWTNLSASQRNDIQNQFPNLGGQSIGFGGGGRGTRVSSDPNSPFGVQIGAQKMQALLSSQTAALADLTTCGPTGPCTPFSADAFIERADVGLYHWMAVKQWEIVETFGLQAQQSFHGSVNSNSWQGDGEVRGWPFSWPSVFYLAPHMLYAPTSTPQGTREFYFAWENRLTSYYRTNAWYQLQVTVNPGWEGASNGPIDWPYTQTFIEYIADDLADAKAPGWIAGTHLARYFEVNAKLAQLANTNISFNTPSPTDPTNIWVNSGLQSKADLLFKLSPSTVLDSGTNQPTQFRALEQIAPGAYLLFVNGSIALYNSLFSNTMRSQYRICDPTNTQMGTPEQFAGQRFCIDAGRTPLPTDSKGMPYCPYPSNVGYTTQQYSFWGVMAAQQLGADAGLVKVWSDWNNQMWPQ
jgi:hypothetical protein